MIFVNFAILIIGFVALIKGADFFVDGSASLARKFGIPSVIIGLTIVALGTSAPELAVSTSAALQGSNEIAFSNVVGSNIFNLLVVLGVCAIIHPVPVDRAILKRDFPFTIVASIFLLLTSGYLALFGSNRAVVAKELEAMLSGTLPEGAMDAYVGGVSRIIGIALIIMFAAYIIRLVRVSRNSAEEEFDGQNSEISMGKSLLMIVFGLALIVAGGPAGVNSAQYIAAAAGMSETLIGLTVVALGTSLPELVTSIVAARKGETGLAVGNVVGSNIFNLMFILGISAMINPISINMASLFDLMILIAISLMAFSFCVSGEKIERKEGIVMVAAYAADMLFAIVR